MSSPQKHEPNVYRYRLPDDWIILVGRSDADNDLLTFEVAKANDYWFHAKGVPGSHVVLQTQNREPARDLLKLGAIAAAFYSKARKGSKVSVSCTKVKNVRKAGRRKAGSVVISQEETLTVRPAEFSTKVSIYEETLEK